MPNIRSAAKRMRQNVVRRTANRSKRSNLRSAIKKFTAAIEQGDLTVATSLLSETASVLGKAAQQGLIHKNNASRHISRLSKKINELKAQKA
jgi:small subunit ribosomal protein S20